MQSFARRRLVIALALTPWGVHSAAGAQSVHWLRATVGVGQSALHNPGESAYRYDGVGPTFALRYGHDVRESTFDFSLGGSFATLNSDATHASATLGTASIGVRYVRGTTKRLGPTEWMLGADVASHLEATNHHYAGPYGSDDLFGFLMIGAGPVVRTRYRTAHAVISNDVTVPVASWIDFPYANGKVNGARVKVAFASLASLQSVDDALSYRVGAAGSAAVTWTYRISYLRYVFADARRVAHQSVSMTFDLPVHRSDR